MKPNELQEMLKNAKMIRVPIAEEETTIEMNEDLVIVPRPQYADLIRKATMYDCLRDDIRSGLDEGDAYPIDNAVVMATTGMNRYKAALTSEKSEMKKKAEEDAKLISEMREKMNVLQAKLEDAQIEREALIAKLSTVKDGKQEAEPHE